jgi:DNA-binding NtrC family response regulator
MSLPRMPCRSERALETDLRASGVAILLVDDETESLEEIVEHLARLGYVPNLEIEDCNTLAQILERPDIRVCLIDLRMTRMSGMDLMTQLHAKHGARARSLRFIVIIGHATSEDEHEAMLAGASILLHKPYSLDEIAEACRSALSFTPD